MRIIPPISVPVGPWSVASSLLARDRAREAFRDQLRSLSGYPTADLFSSGRAALAAFLAAKKRAGQTEVAVPAYTCWSVPAAIVRAGLTVRLVDIDPATLDLEPDSLGRAVSDRLAAVVAAHLFAENADVDGVVARVRSRGSSATIVDDRAQAWLGPGTRAADSVLLSFGRGKPLPLGGGGALLHGGASLAPEPPSVVSGIAAASAFAATSALAKPFPYRVLARVPILGIGSTRYDPAFPWGVALHGWQASLGCRMVGRLAVWIARRTANARQLASCVETVRGWSVARPGHREGPLRLPILAPSRSSRDNAMAALLRQGVGASAMYPGTLLDIPALRPRIANPEERVDGANDVAARLFTVPVYPTLTPDEVARIASGLEHALSESGR